MRENRKFGKRVITVLLALIMVVSLIPPCLTIVAEEDYSHLIGATVEFNKDSFYMYKEPGSYSQGFYKSELPQYLRILDVAKAYYGTSLRTYYKLGTIDKSAAEDILIYNWIWDADVTIVSLPEPEPDDNPEGYVKGKVGLLMDGELVERFTLKRGEKILILTDLADEIEGTPSYQWQMLVEKADNRWANILYAEASFATVTESLVENARNAETGYMTLRCVVTCAGLQYVSNTVQIALSPASAGNSSSAQSASMDSYAAGSEGEIDPNAFEDEPFQIEVSYVYWNNSEIAHDIHGVGAVATFTVTLLPSVSYNGQREHPVIPGYKAYIRDDSATGNNFREYTALEDRNDPNSSQTHKYVEAEPIVFENENVGRKVLVYYLPVEVNFRVNHYIQNLENDEYRLLKTDVKIAYSDSSVGKNLELKTTSDYADIAGFTALFYDPDTRVSANGNTAIDIYYDRNYYLIDFDLTMPNGQKGFGVMPLYVRYGTSLMLPTPTGAGYAFSKWNLSIVYNRIEQEESDGSITITEQVISDQTIRSAYTNTSAMLTIKHNLDYTSTWNVAQTTYTIAYWIESAESADSSNAANYGIWYTVSVPANTGSNTERAQNLYSETNFKNQLSNMNTIATDTTGKNKEITAAKNDVTSMYPYISYQSGLSTTTVQTVKGDGSTVVNVYFARKSYTLKFYYAIENDNKFYIIGGSSYDFAYKSNPTEGMRQYAPGQDKFGGATGQIQAEPKLNAKGEARRSSYTISKQTDGNNKYLYISFTAKYGADLTELWPCDIFEPATRTSGNTHGQWSGNQAFMSAWNGEAGVKYTYDHLESNKGNGNLTIKGNYTQLDANLLWKDMSNTSTTVCYACFWENGANVNWSVPELYRYKLWLPVLPGVTYPATKEFNGFTYTATYDKDGDGKADYYLASCYDTCDDSDQNGQTQPALVGFTPSVANNRTYITDLYQKGNYNSLTNDERKLVSQAEFNAICATNSSYRSLYKEAWVMNYFYDRLQHNFIYDDQNGKNDIHPVDYGVSLNTDEFKKVGGPDYPSVFEQGEYTFDGWYVDKACTIRFDFNITMPDRSIKVYAKWNPTYWNVVVYQQEPKGDSSDVVLATYNNVKFGTLLTSAGGEPIRTPPVKGYIFAGWYYMDGSSEKRFDFNTMTVKHDYVIYAKWTSEVPVPYTVKYVIIKNGQEIEIADRTTGVSLANVSKSFSAKIDKELYVGYQTGYFPKTREQTFKMEEGSNVIVFEYSYDEEVPYRIKHVFTSSNFIQHIGSDTLEIVWENSATQNDSALMTISFRGLITKDEISAKLKKQYSTNTIDKIWNIIIALSPDAYSKRLILEAGTSAEDNEVVFNWEARSDKVVYEVHHMYESLTDADKYEEKLIETYEVPYSAGSKANYQQSLIKGYVFTKYETNNKNNKDLTLKKPTGTDEGLIITVYYERETYSYTVKFYDDDSNTPIPNVSEVTTTGKYGQKIQLSSVAKNISGYRLSNGDTVVELNYDKQELVCEYTRLSIRYEYIIEGVGGSFNNFQETVLYGDSPAAITLYLVDGYLIEGWEYKIDNGEYAAVTSAQATIGAGGDMLQPVKPTVDYVGKTIYFKVKLVPTSFTIQNQGSIEEDQGFIYVIKNTSTGTSIKVVVVGNTSTTVCGMPVGNYVITLEDEWSWRYDNANVNNNSAISSSTVAYRWDLRFDGDESATVVYSNPNQDFVSDNSHKLQKTQKSD